MKKFFVILLSITLCMGLTACDSGVRTGNSENGEQSETTSNILNSTGSDNSRLENSNSNNSSSVDREKLTENIYITYDRSKYENVTAPKCYYADFQKIEDETFLALFSSIPKYSEQTGLYTTDNETGANTSGSLLRKDGNAFMYFMSYWTQFGDDYDTAVGENYEKYSTTKEFDFMNRDALTADFLNKTDNIFTTDLEIKAYAIDAESYLKEIGNYDSEQQKIPHPNSYEKTWSEECDYYYIVAYQTVDGVPIFEGMSGDAEKGTLVEGCTINAVYTKNGLEYIRISSPWNVTEESPTENKFIDLKGAEEIIKAKNENLLTSKQRTLEAVQLVYIPIVKADGTILTPVWEFYDYMGIKYPVYRVNANTGEML